MRSVGAGSAVAWPAGTGGKGNEGVASYVQRIKGSIGYVEYAYALQNKMTYAQLKNREGNFVSRTLPTSRLPLRMPSGCRQGLLRDPDQRTRKDSWPSLAPLSS